MFLYGVISLCVCLLLMTVIKTIKQQILTLYCSWEIFVLKIIRIYLPNICFGIFII